MDTDPASHSAYDLRRTPPKALTFDVFGTVVNWRKSVTSALISSAEAKLSSPSSLSAEIQKKLSHLTALKWAEFAQEWRNSYMKFVIGYKPNEDEWLDIDTHHKRSLLVLLKTHGLEGLYDEEEIEKLSKIWHFLEPWKDSSEGLQRLGAKFVTSALSNGNHSLLRDLNEFGNLGFQLLQSAEDFKAYKPHSTVYQGACRKLGLESGEVAMVAAHLGDLKYARATGMRTIYIEREREEGLDPQSDEYAYAKTWVDMWITKEEDGLVEVARRFGV